MKKIQINIVLLVLGVADAYAQHAYCNLMNISYRLCHWMPSRREAAYPTMVVFMSEYYLFASKSGGY